VTHGHLWIEAEHLAEDVTDFCNIMLTMSTGERYALNVWTFDFFAQAVAQGELHASPRLQHTYMHPPDLFVKDLTRPTLEAAVVDLVERGRMPRQCLVVGDVDVEVDLTNLGDTLSDD